MVAKLKSGQKILFIGDSITDCGRYLQQAPLGDGYVSLFSEFMMIRQPQKKIEIVNKGIGGNNVVDLQNRWADDVLPHKPDWLSIEVGINDLHQSFNVDNPAPITPDKFEEVYDEILARTRKALPKCKILLIDPFYISQDNCPNSFRNQVLPLLPKYIKAVAKMSRKYDTARVQTHEMFQKLLKYNEADKFCPEPVHPYRIGHLAIAEAVYNVLSK